MTVLTRRTMLAGAAAMSALPAAGWWPARAAAPVAEKQAASFYRYKVGSIEITVVSDGIAKVPVTEAFVLNAKVDEVNAALREAFMEPGTLIGPYNPIVINTGTKLALVDMGLGEANYFSSKGLDGQLLANLAAAGIDRNAIDTIIISHYHGDHINGLLKPTTRWHFPTRKSWCRPLEHKYWTDAGEESRSSTQRIADNFKNVRRVMNPEVLKRLRTYEWDKEVIPGVLAVGTPATHPAIRPTSSPRARPRFTCRPM